MAMRMAVQGAEGRGGGPHLLAVAAAGGDDDHGGNNPPIAPRPMPAALYRPGYVVLARPLGELWAHIYHLELPAWELLARSVKVLVLALFRWHFCDHVLLLRPEALYHSLNRHMFRREEDHERGNLTLNRYPHLMEKALYLEPIDEHPNAELPHANFPVMNIELGDHAVAWPQFPFGTEISAQTIRGYFARMYRIRITDREEGNTVTDLYWSRHLREVALNEIR